MSDFNLDAYLDYTLIRTRFIPDERVELKEDQIFLVTEDMIVTAWQSLKPRTDIKGGISVYYPKQGFKISKVYDHAHKLVHWYCDIIRLTVSGHMIESQDLLLDVTISPDGSICVLDADELADVLESGKIDPATACLALRQLNSLLSILYAGEFYVLQKPALELEHILFPAS